MIYYIIDIRFPYRYKVITILPGTEGKDYLYHFVYQTQTIKEVVQYTKRAILESKLGYRSIDAIRLCGHGNSGYLQLGEGLTESNAAEFKALANFLKADAYNDGIQIHGCGVGSDTSVVSPDSTINNPVCIPGTASKGKGYSLLRMLADSINRNVTAGLNCQYADEGWKFEEPTITVCPGGSYGIVSTY